MALGECATGCKAQSSGHGRETGGLSHDRVLRLVPEKKSTLCANAHALCAGALPDQAEACPELMVVGAAADLAVVADEKRRALVERRGGGETDDGAVALRRGAPHRELRTGCGGKGSRHRP